MITLCIYQLNLNKLKKKKKDDQGRQEGEGHSGKEGQVSDLSWPRANPGRHSEALGDEHGVLSGSRIPRRCAAA